MDLRISLLGRVVIEADGSSLDESALPGHQGRLLFAYLLSQQGRAVPRDELAGLLWSGPPPARWDKAISVLVSKLRVVLERCGVDGRTALRSAYGCYQLVLPVGTLVDVEAAVLDVEVAEAALTAGDFAKARDRAGTAAALVGDRFLPGEEGPWVEQRRRGLAQLHVRALECLADACLAGGDAREAVRHAAALVALEPYREGGHRRLMQAHAHSGDNAEALRAYERCRQLLADELGAYPSAETEAVYVRVLRSGTNEVPPRQPLAPHHAEPGKTGDPVTTPPRASTEPPDVAALEAGPPLRPRRSRTRLVFSGVVACATLAVTLAAGPLGDAHDARAAAIATINADRCSPLHHGRAGRPDLLVVADLPLQPGAVALTSPMVDAMTLALERRGYRAGSHSVGLQVCDAATPVSLFFDPPTCRANAKLYARNRSVVGLVGPLTSLCARVQVPILNRARGGPVAVVSPSATYVGLTRAAPGIPADEPDVFYPTGMRNFARVVPADDAQAAAHAIVARRLGVQRAYLVDAPGYGSPLVDDLARTADRLGIDVVGRATWTEEPSEFAAFADTVARSGADGVFLAGAPEDRGVQLLRVLRERLGPDVQLMASDALDPATALLAGAAAEGMTFSQPGPANEHLEAAGMRFVAAFSRDFGVEPSRFAVAAAQAMDVLLDAIARSDGTRASVTEHLFTTRISNGVFGSFWITPSGDTTLQAVAIERIVDGRVTTFDTVTVPDTLLAPILR